MAGQAAQWNEEEGGGGHSAAVRLILLLSLLPETTSDALLIQIALLGGSQISIRHLQTLLGEVGTPNMPQISITPKPQCKRPYNSEPRERSTYEMLPLREGEELTWLSTAVYSLVDTRGRHAITEVGTELMCLRRKEMNISGAHT